MHRNRIPGSWLLTGILLLAGCGTVQSQWPFGKAAVEVPQPVSELQLEFPDKGVTPAVVQYWERNTLVVDLQKVAGAGQIVLARRTGHSWPARIAVRMAPQRFEVVEVRGSQRVLLPVTAPATGAITAELPPGIHDQATAALTISWGAKDAF